MIQAFLVVVFTFLVLLMPFKFQVKGKAKSEKELNGKNTTSVSLHLNSSPMGKSDSANSKKLPEKTLELPSEIFEDEPLQSEPWMENPKDWDMKPENKSI